MMIGAFAMGVGLSAWIARQKEDRMRIGAAVLALGVAMAAPAHAHRGLAPWENGDPLEGDTCLQCHWDAETAVQSEALTVEGLPVALEAGASYELTVRLAAAGMGAAGFLVSAVDANGAGAGAFHAVGDGRIEPNKAQARSTTAAAAPDEGVIEWRMNWTAPDEIAGPIRFYLSANAANDDQSPFGDRIHFREEDH